jgi:transposase-like protein
VPTPSVSGLFKWRQFEQEVILLAVGWYLRFSLSYRDVEELLAEQILISSAGFFFGRQIVVLNCPACSERNDRLSQRYRPQTLHDSWHPKQLTLALLVWAFGFRTESSCSAGAS